MDERGEGRNSGGMRASDGDRQAVVDRLRRAVDEGRLGLLEWNERVARAYQSVTYDELAEVAADLPAEPAAPSHPRRAAPRTAGGAWSQLPTWLTVLWTIWLTVVLINVVVWLLVSLGSGLTYFWPAWVAGPTAAGLVGLSLIARAAPQNDAPQNDAPQNRV